MQRNQVKTAVSVIVPVYNTGKYLRQCLDSLIAQTLQSLEIILIDDGSTDDSAAICREYAAADVRIVLRRQENAGVATALRRGLELASGEYVSFCGSDDFVSPGYFQSLYDAARRENADIAQCGYSLYYDDEKRAVPFPEHFLKPLLKRCRNRIPPLLDVLLLLPPLTVRRLHRREILEKYPITFDQELRMAEDLLFSAEFFLVSERIVQIDQTGYFYRQQRNARQTLAGDARLLDFFLIFDKLRKFARSCPTDCRGEITLLEINTLLYQHQRLDSSVRSVYEKRFLERLNAERFTLYCGAAFRCCRKKRSLKHCLQDAACCIVLGGAFLCRRHDPGIAFLRFAAWLRKGSLLKSRRQ